MGTQKQDDPHYGEPTDQEPHMGETEEPKGTGQKQTSTGTGATRETDTDADDAKRSGMRPTGSGGSAPPATENL
jgi:hypothetical protein